MYICIALSMYTVLCKILPSNSSIRLPSFQLDSIVGGHKNSNWVSLIVDFSFSIGLRENTTVSLAH